MSIDNALASVAVKNLKVAVAWYEQLMGRPADSTPMPEVAERAVFKISKQGENLSKR